MLLLVAVAVAFSMLMEGWRQFLSPLENSLLDRLSIPKIETILYIVRQYYSLGVIPQHVKSFSRLANKAYRRHNLSLRQKHGRLSYPSSSDILFT